VRRDPPRPLEIARKTPDSGSVRDLLSSSGEQTNGPRIRRPLDPHRFAERRLDRAHSPL
jgi:hypothetical protein